MTLSLLISIHILIAVWFVTAYYLAKYIYTTTVIVAVKRVFTKALLSIGFIIITEIWVIDYDLVTKKYCENNPFVNTVLYFFIIIPTVFIFLNYIIYNHLVLTYNNKDGSN